MKVKVFDKETKRKSKVLSKQLSNINRQEQKILSKKENKHIKDNISPVVDKVQEFIPVKLQNALNTAFYKGFQLVFEKGNVYIEKTYNKNKIELNYDLNNYAVDKKLSNKFLKKLDRHSKNSKNLNSALAALEGGVLGLFGIGLPDIPLFISMIIRTINEIALSYGYQYETEEERVYILYLICGSITKEEKQREYDNKIENLGKDLDNGIITTVDLAKEMEVTANILSEALLTAKFVQGIPVVGAIGGLINHSIINKVAKYSRIKYKKRYLLKKTKEL